MVENIGFKVLSDFNAQCDKIVEDRGPESSSFSKQAKETKFKDIGIPEDAGVKDKNWRKWKSTNFFERK